MVRDWLKSTFFTYETPHLVVFESRFVGVLNKILQLLLFALVIIYIFIINNGYQYIDNGVVGGFTTKVKGVAFTNSTDERIGRHIFDAADMRIPPQDNGVFFVPTKFIFTNAQVQTTCTDIESTQTICSKDEDCKEYGEPYHITPGISTGKCNATVGHCIITSWCPRENDSLSENDKTATLQNVKDFTVLIKNFVHFPYFGKSRSNLIETMTKESLKNCRYHPQKDPFCPIFRLGTIVGLAGLGTSEPQTEQDDEYFEKMAIAGGIVSIRVKWDCNFDYADHHCKPTYLFSRLDNQNAEVISKGYNFRFAVPYTENGEQKRNLAKTFGILFLLKTEASGRAFDTTTFFLNVGSGLGLLGVAAIVSDIVLFNLHRHRNYFRPFQTQPVVTVAQRKRDALRKTNNNDGESYVDVPAERSA